MTPSQESTFRYDRTDICDPQVWIPDPAVGLCLACGAIAAQRHRSVQPAAAAQTAPVTPPRQSQQRTPQSGPTLLVIIDGPKAGASVPLTSESITLGRAASNTVVLDDEFVSSHHARIYKDPASGQWAIEDLGSTNGTIVNQQRLNMPMLLPPRMPVRIGATTFELR